MTVVKDPEFLNEKAQNLVHKLMETVTKELKPMAQKEDGLAESIYFLTHVAAYFKVRICMSCHAFGKNFDIEKLNFKTISDIIDEIALENCNLNLNIVDDVINFLNDKMKEK